MITLTARRKSREASSWAQSAAWLGPPDPGRSGQRDRSASHALTPGHGCGGKGKCCNRRRRRAGRKGETSGLDCPCSERLKLFLTGRHLSRVSGSLVRGWNANCLLTPVWFKFNLWRLNIPPFFFFSQGKQLELLSKKSKPLFLKHFHLWLPYSLGIEGTSHFSLSC